MNYDKNIASRQVSHAQDGTKELTQGKGTADNTSISVVSSHAYPASSNAGKSVRSQIDPSSIHKGKVEEEKREETKGAKVVSTFLEPSERKRKNIVVNTTHCRNEVDTV